MPDPTSRQAGHPDTLLTNVALSYAKAMGDVYIADKVFPVVGVTLPSAKYKTFPRSYFLQDNVGARPDGGYPRQAGYRMSEDSYSLDEEALEAVITDREKVTYVGPISGSPEAAKVRLLQSQHLIHRDKAWANAYFKAGVWSRDLAGIASGSPSSTQFLRWDNDDSDPMTLFMVESFGVGQKVGGAWRPRTLVLGVNAFIRLANHPLILGRLGVNTTRMVDQTLLAQLLQVDKVLVAQGVVNTGPEHENVEDTEAAADYDWIVGANDALLVYTAPQPSTEEPSGGYTFAWRGLLGAQAFDPTAAVTRGRDDRGKFDWFQVSVAYDMKVVAPELGVFFEDAVSG